MVIAQFNPPQDMIEVQQILLFALHPALFGVARVSDGGDGPVPTVAIQWSDETDDAVDDGVVLYMTDRQYSAYRRALDSGRLSLDEPEQGGEPWPDWAVGLG